MTVSNQQFEEIINAAMASLPGEHAAGIENIAILYQDEPTPEQRIQLQLRHDQTLLGLYEGVPLSKRQGMVHVLPDKITVFKVPLERSSYSVADLQEKVRHTLWHEIAHYYGLGHDQIRELE
jgi:predicted Zn-dependent protease with MMP-like domain